MSARRVTSLMIHNPLVCVGKSVLSDDRKAATAGECTQVQIGGVGTYTVRVSVTESLVLTTWKVRETLSGMETNESFERPSPTEAAAALEAAQQARAAGHKPIPAWFFPACGLLMAVALVLQALDEFVSLALVAVLVAGYVVTERVYNKQVDQSGIAPRNLTIGQQLVLVTPLAAIWVAAEILDARGDWIWVVAAVAGGGWTVGYGLVHNRRARTPA